jgi:hypothetical protein
MNRLTLILAVLLLAVRAALAADFRVFQATWNEPATTQPVPLTAIPPVVERCLWTATHGAVWPDPPTWLQVQAFARVAVKGGPTPYAGVVPQWTETPYRADTFVLLDGENRTDDDIARFVNQYRLACSQFGRIPAFGVYAIRYSPPDQSYTDAADDNVANVRGYERRRDEIAGLVKSVPVIVLEEYIYPPSDQWMRARETELAIVRRLYPNKPVYALARGDINGTLYDDGFRGRYVRWLRSRFNGVICWGERKNNAALLTDLAAAR